MKNAAHCACIACVCSGVIAGMVELAGTPGIGHGPGVMPAMGGGTDTIGGGQLLGPGAAFGLACMICIMSCRCICCIIVIC